jgi:NAD(P)-dependent dehydrogenase (short-subunit alcohol dehydrogenase family)
MPQRNWLITGVSSGFGRIMTEQLLARGDRIAGTVHNLSVMDDLKAKYGDRLWLVGQARPVREMLSEHVSGTS